MDYKWYFKRRKWKLSSWVKARGLKTVESVNGAIDGMGLFNKPDVDTVKQALDEVWGEGPTLYWGEVPHTIRVPTLYWGDLPNRPQTRPPPHIPFIYLRGRTDLFDKNVAKKKVLVLGSGPSARDVDWKSYDWEVLVTTSFFYCNDEVVAKKPMHVCLTNLVELTDKRLLQYLDSNPECTVSFEPKINSYISRKNLPTDQTELINLVKNLGGFYDSEAFLSFTEKYGDRMIFHRTNGGKEGVAGRVCWLVLNSNPEKLYVCGIDGVSKNRNRDPQNYFRDHTGTTVSYSYEDYLASYEYFAEQLYIISKGIGTKVVNLGKGKPYNMMTNVSKKYEFKETKLTVETQPEPEATVEDTQVDEVPDLEHYEPSDDNFSTESTVVT